MWQTGLSRSCSSAAICASVVGDTTQHRAAPRPTPKYTCTNACTILTVDQLRTVNAVGAGAAHEDTDQIFELRGPDRRTLAVYLQLSVR